MLRILDSIFAGFKAFTRSLWLPGQLPGCCFGRPGDHPDIESAMLTGYPLGVAPDPDDFTVCNGCQEEIFLDDSVLTDCDLRVCRWCKRLCEGCDSAVGCLMLE